jgi:hypothetical protein
VGAHRRVRLRPHRRLLLCPPFALPGLVGRSLRILRPPLYCPLGQHRVAYNPPRRCSAIQLPSFPCLIITLSRAVPASLARTTSTVSWRAASR